MNNLNKKILFILMIMVTVFSLSANQTFKEFIPKNKIAQDKAVSFTTDI